MQILTHRGLEPLNQEFTYTESSREAFENHLKRGYGLEFDINFSQDLFPFVFHDESLTRITNNQDTRNFSELSEQEILSYPLKNSAHFIGFQELLELINQYRKPWEYSALHLKAKFQEPIYLDIFIDIFNKYPNIENKIFVFDIKISTAQYLKKRLPQLKLFPSASHSYDILRYNKYTGETLLSLEEIFKNKHLFFGVWLDEWDTKDIQGQKKLYTKEVFQQLRSKNLQIGLVTPELHAKSPGLLGGEAHEDCENIEKLSLRLEEIINLKPDFICSDYLELL